VTTRESIRRVPLRVKGAGRKKRGPEEMDPGEAIASFRSTEMTVKRQGIGGGNGRTVICATESVLEVVVTEYFVKGGCKCKGNSKQGLCKS